MSSRKKLLTRTRRRCWAHSWFSIALEVRDERRRAGSFQLALAPQPPACIYLLLPLPVQQGLPHPPADPLKEASKRTSHTGLRQRVRDSELRLRQWKSERWKLTAQTGLEDLRREAEDRQKQVDGKGEQGLGGTAVRMRHAGLQMRRNMSQSAERVG